MCIGNIPWLHVANDLHSNWLVLFLVCVRQLFQVNPFLCVRKFLIAFVCFFLVVEFVVVVVQTYTWTLNTQTHNTQTRTKFQVGDNFGDSDNWIRFISTEVKNSFVFSVYVCLLLFVCVCVCVCWVLDFVYRFNAIDT